MTDTVSIGCKMQHGIALKVHRFDPDLGRVREIGVIELNGTRHDHSGLGSGPEFPMRPTPVPQAGHAVTHGVDKALFDAWLDANRNDALLTSGSVFLVE